MKIKNKRKFIFIIQLLNLLAQTASLIFYVKTFLLAIDHIYENPEKNIDKTGRGPEGIILEHYYLLTSIDLFAFLLSFIGFLLKLYSLYTNKKLGLDSLCAYILICFIALFQFIYSFTNNLQSGYIILLVIFSLILLSSTIVDITFIFVIRRYLKEQNSEINPLTKNNQKTEEIISKGNEKENSIN